jgi:hypothetical protein
MNPSFAVSLLVVFFSYLIWFQSYRKNISEVERRMNSSFNMQSGYGRGDNYALTFVNIICKENSNLKYKLKKNLIWFGNIDGETQISAHISPIRVSL